jgi:hypothetical protein
MLSVRYRTKVSEFGMLRATLSAETRATRGCEVGDAWGYRANGVSYATAQTCIAPRLQHTADEHLKDADAGWK